LTTTTTTTTMFASSFAFSEKAKAFFVLAGAEVRLVCVGAAKAVFLLLR
jgi:hypothetical protein